MIKEDLTRYSLTYLGKAADMACFNFTRVMSQSSCLHETLANTATTSETRRECFISFSRTDKKKETPYLADEDMDSCWLHLQCPWRLRKGKHILLGNQDFYHQAGDTDTWNDYVESEDVKGEGSYFDKTLAERIWKYLPLGITFFEEFDMGDICIIFEKGLVLEVFPVFSACIAEEEWRFCHCGPKEKHFIFRNPSLIQNCIVQEKKQGILQREEPEGNVQDDCWYLTDITRIKGTALFSMAKAGIKTDIHIDKKQDGRLDMFCPWRMEQNEKVLVGYQDFFYGEESDKEENEMEGCYFDAIIEGIVAPRLPLKVLGVEKSEMQDLVITFEKQFVLRVFPTLPSDIKEISWGFLDWNREEDKNRGKGVPLRVLVVDDTNDGLSQLLEYQSYFDYENAFWFESAGINPARKLSKEAEREKRVFFYNRRLMDKFYPKALPDMGKYDYIVPIGVEIRKEAAGRAVIVTNFQQDKIAEYKNTKPEELVKLYAAICDKIEYLEKMQKTTEV